METNEKLGFFKKFYMAIVKIDEYARFLEEKTSKAIGYFTILVLLTSTIFGVISTIDFGLKFSRGYEFFKTLPEFEYKDGILEDGVYASGYDEEFETFFVMDTSKDYKNISEVEEHQKESFGNNYLDSSIRILVYKSKAFIDYEGTLIEITYNEFTSETGIESITKQNLIDEYETIGLYGVSGVFFAYGVILNFITMFTTYILDIVMLGILAQILAMIICRIKMTFSQGITLGCYAITLPIVLSVIYSVVNYFTGFYMEYFSYMTLIIEYLYIVAVIFILKSDKLKMEEELAKIMEKHEEFKKERIEEEKKEEEPKDKVEEDKKEEEKEETDKEEKEESKEDKGDNPVGSEI